MRLGCFRFGRFFGGFFFSLEPLGMEDSGLVDALISVRAKKIALRLQEIRWQSGGAITVKIRQRGGKRGDRYAEFDSCRNDQAPFRLRSFDDSCEIPIEQKIVQCGVALICLNDPVQKFRPNDATAPPYRELCPPEAGLSRDLFYGKSAT